MINILTSVRPVVRDTHEFPITVVLQQSPVRSSYLFILIMDKLTDRIQERIADEVLIDEISEDSIKARAMEKHFSK